MGVADIEHDVNWWKDNYFSMQHSFDWLVRILDMVSTGGRMNVFHTSVHLALELAYLLIGHVYVRIQQPDIIRGDHVRYWDTAPANFIVGLLPGGNTSLASFLSTILGWGLMTDQALTLTHQGGVEKTLSDWLPMFGMKVKANKIGLSGRWWWLSKVGPRHALGAS